MEAHLTVDWDAPWFAPWRTVGEPVLQAWRTRPLHAALNAWGSAPVQFVEPEQLAAGEAYEAFIFRTRCCPTRSNAHDFFNGLAWLRFPDEKTRLNELQAAQIATAGIGEVRGAIRDAITLLDENGAFLQAPAPLWDALRVRDWRRLFVHLRPLWNEARVEIFGHALLEKLMAPRKDLTAHVWCGTPQLAAYELAEKPFAPLPVMGIPGWHPGSHDFSFYDDSLVFRNPRVPSRILKVPVPPASGR